MIRFAFFVAIAMFLQGCSQQPKTLLVPRDEVTVYQDIAGRRPLGKSREPMEVVKCIYPDKTDYVVEVVYKGGTAYVRDGWFAFEQPSKDKASIVAASPCSE